jgi:hypothetical protein
LKEKVKKICELIQKYQGEYGYKLFHSFSTENPDICMELMTGPIEDSGVEGMVAKKIAEKYGLKLKLYDFSGGKWSEPRDYRYVFSLIVPDDESEYESCVKKLYESRKELDRALNQLVKSLGY